MVLVIESMGRTAVPVSSIAWLDVSLRSTVQKKLPETNEEGKRKPTDDHGKSCRVENEGNA
jgi:hypothetical protein